MAHKFDVSARKKLNSEERRRLLSPEETLTKLGLNTTSTMADIGCGTGLFTIPAAKRAPDATIYAVDILPQMLQEVTQAAENEGLHNIVAVQSEEYDFKLKDETADFILLCTVLHEVDDKQRLLTECARVCRSGGKIAVIEFAETNTGFGPPLAHRIKRAEAVALLAETGFADIAVMDIGEAFYAVTGIK